MNKELKKLEELLANDRKIIEDNYKEIVRLKELCNKYEEEHKTTFEEWKKTINIINELEKWLRSEIKRIEELQNLAKSKVKPYGEEYNNYTLIIGAYDNVLDKLQELKGSDK